MNSESAVLMAAGLGTRMRPLRYKKQDYIAYAIVLLYFAVVIAIGIIF